MLPIIITGAAGRMGQELVSLVLGSVTLASRDFALVGAVEDPKSHVIGQTRGKITIQGGLEKALESAGSKGVIIDFTIPEASVHHAEIASKRGTPLVIGTTGFNSDQLKKIEKASRQIPIILSPNMSVGVNTVFKLVGETAKILGENYDIEILEAHHKHKKDAPSGTAVRIAQILAEATGRRYPEDFKLHREGMIGERSSKEIGIQVLRGGDIVGEHAVFYCGEGERVEIRHVATHRKTFAQGALRAAQWISGQKPGLYDMKDVLGV